MSYQFSNRFDRLPFNGGSVFSNAQGDFSVATTSGTKTMTVTGLPFTLEAVHVVAGSARSITTAGMVTTLPLSSVSVSSGVITLSDVSANFDGTESILLHIVGPDKTFDNTLDVVKTSEQAPLWNRFTDSESIISASQNVTTTWVDIGPELDTRGYNTLVAYVTVDINAGSGVKLKALAKTAYAGASEYDIPTKTTVTSGTTVYGHFYQFGADVDQLVALDWDVTGIPYVQLQVMANVSGTAASPCQIDALEIIKSF